MQNDLFTDASVDWEPVPEKATVHDILERKGGRRAASAYARLTQPHVGRRAPIDLLAGPRGSRIITAAADTAEAKAKDIVDTAINFVYSGWCIVGLPYREPKGPDAHVWRTDTDYATIVVDAGNRALEDGSVESIGVPYGAYARVINISIQHLAREQGRDIELGTTGNDVLRKLGLPRGGKVASSALTGCGKTLLTHKILWSSPPYASHQWCVARLFPQPAKPARANGIMQSPFPDWI